MNYCDEVCPVCQRTASAHDPAGFCPKNAIEVMRAMCDLASEDVMGMTDAEVRARAEADGIDLEANAARFRENLKRAEFEELERNNAELLAACKGLLAFVEQFYMCPPIPIEALAPRAEAYRVIAKAEGTK